MIQVTESFQGQLHSARIDDHFKEPLDCLKMDIEGAEAYALLLGTHQPDLAAAAHHKPHDLVALHRQICDLG